MVNASNKSYKLECYCGENAPHYYFNFRCKDNWAKKWELTLLDDSEIPGNEELAGFIAEIFEREEDCFSDERIVDITVLSVDKKTSVCIDMCEHHPCVGPGQFKTGQQNVLEILQAHDFKMC